MKKISVLILFLAACSGDSSADNNGVVIDFDLGNGDDVSLDIDNTPDQGSDDVGTETKVATIIGEGDGTAESVTFTQILAANNLQASDLEFNPVDDSQLWVLQRGLRSENTCTQADRSGCGSLEGYATIISDPGESNQFADRRKDPNSWHFLRRPSSFAFGKPGVWASCGEARTGNFLDGAPDYMGPSLWSSDLDVFAKDPGQGLNGSHLDMLHETPFCMGIAHETENIYWAFNGDAGSLDKIDFAEDHGPGHDDHADGQVFRYLAGQVLRVEDLPSGMHFDDATSLLYVVDSGNKRVISMDTTSGDRGGAITPIYEALADNAMFTNAITEDIVEAGVLEKPSGLLFHEDILYVTDNATGKIHAFDLEGKEVRQLQTPFDGGGLSAITLGPDGKVYIASLLDSSVLRIDLP